MTIYEALKISSPQIEMLTMMGANPNDCSYLKLYEDYMAMKQEGEKVSYIVAKLATSYKVSERTIYDVVKRMQSYCNPFSAE